MSAADRIYLDHNATTPIDPEVQVAIDRCQASKLGNPGSQHAAGRRARQIVDDARDRIAEILGARLDGPRADRLVFTSGGTEANNLAIFGQLPESGGSLIHSAIEHPSVVAAADEIARRGGCVRQIPVNGDGIIVLESLEQLLEARRPELVCAMTASNETGVIEPIAEVVALCNRWQVPVHSDAVQLAGKLPVDFRGLAVATLSVAAHKFHGPVGIGALLVRADVNLHPRLFGGHQQSALRPGTEPVALIVGMLRALELWQAAGPQRTEAIRALRDRFEQRLKAGWPALVIHAAQVARLPNTSNVSFPGVNRQALLMALDLAGVECATGSACASGSSEPSPTLVAMGLPEELIASALRFSIGPTTTERDVDTAVARILSTLHDMEARTSRGKIPSPTRQSVEISL